MGHGPQRPRSGGDFRRDNAVQSVANETNPNVAHETLTKSPATYPIPLPAPQTPDSHIYEVYAAVVGVGALAHRSNGGPLVAGTSFTMRVGSFPEKWRLNFVTASGTQTLWVKAGDDAELPAELVIVGVNGLMGFVVPARGRSLTVRADNGNSAPVSFTALAVGGLDLKSNL